jgi:hypothetical protein
VGLQILTILKKVIKKSSYKDKWGGIKQTLKPFRESLDCYE